ncbi:thioredoxin domain-containing protein 12 [Biomphalaria glabrata]|nr:thioredoxin domain-containing protein 12 [Biomphalaria glabrata]
MVLRFVISQVFVPALKACNKTIDGGWGTSFDWVPIDDAFAKAAKENKKVMVIIHKQSCKACRYQKSWFSRSKAILSLSTNFVMTNIEYSQAALHPKYSPDGSYVPRILFFDSDGTFLKDLMAPSKEEGVLYHYRDEQELLTTMKTALKG